VDVSVGVPPDAFSETGQDWGLPGYRWDVMAPGGYEWLRQRVRRCTELYDGFRIDHLVGFYRTYVKAQDGTSAFWPDDEGAQLAQGERLIEVFGSTGARIIAEDLGTVPDFVRESLDAPACARDEGAALGARMGGRRGSRSAIPPPTRPTPSPSAARTTPRRWRSGGTRRTPTSAAPPRRSRR
jgi:hypothetical protein